MSILNDDEITLRVSQKTPFTELLKHTNSIIANSVLISGGTIVKEMVYPHDKYEVDIDMYVSTYASHTVLNGVKEILGECTIETVHQPSYDESFLKKNGILMTVFFTSHKSKL
jgi:hypothetical protein